MAPLQIFRSYLKTPFIVLLIVETCVLFGTVFSASFIHFYASGQDFIEVVESLWISASVIAIVTAVSMLSTGLYVGHLREGMAGVLIRVAISMAMASVIAILVFYLWPDLTLGRGVLAIVYIQAFFVIGTIRAVFFELVDTSVFKSRVLVYGAGIDASHIDLKLRRKADRRNFDIIGYVLLDNQECRIPEDKLILIESSLLEYVQQNQVDEIVVATNDVDAKVRVEELVDCKLNGIKVVDILSFFERESGQIRIDIMEPTWLVTSDGFRQSLFQNFLKRIFDLILSVILLIFTIPIQIIIVIVMWLEDGFSAPIIYYQERTGENGKCFNVYKFRSMITDAEKEGKAVWANRGDSRITKAGGYLRKYRLDEIPQVVNIIKGDMSFVGPRPERPEFVCDLSSQIPYYKERHIVKPGLTGWAQLNYPYGSSIDDAYQKHLFDMYYVKNHSLFLDCLIALQTVEIIIFGKGAR